MSSEETEKTAGRAAARKAEEADRHGAAGIFLPAPDRTGTADVRAGVSVAVRFHNEQPGAVRLSAAAVSGRRGLHQLEGAAILSNAGALPQPSFVYAAVFYGVLELGQAGDDYPGGSASGRCACGLGLCRIQVPGEKAFFYHIYCAYASAFPGDHAFPVSGAGQGGSDEYALGGYFTGGFFHVSGVFDLQGVLHNSVRAAGGWKN